MAARPIRPGWDVRVVPNKFPALERGGEPGHEVHGLFERMNGIGAHEVVVDTPDHETAFASLSNEQIGRVLWAARERVLALRADPAMEYVIVFKNHGAQAGATREHAHSQIMALPIVPDFVREEVGGAVEHFAATNRCVFCEMLREEREDTRRVIVENETVVAIAPYASRYAFETWILPKRHGSAFEDAPQPVHDGMAAGIRSVLGRMNRALGNPPYNLIVHSAPFHEDVRPRLSLARRGCSAAVAHRRFRVGNRVLHQPDASGGRSGQAARCHVEPVIKAGPC